MHHPLLTGILNEGYNSRTRQMNPDGVIGMQATMNGKFKILWQ